VMDDATYRRWSGLDRYGTLILFGAFFAFRVQSQTALTSMRDESLRWILRLVGA